MSELLWKWFSIIDSTALANVRAVWESEYVFEVMILLLLLLLFTSLGFSVFMYLQREKILQTLEKQSGEIQYLSTHCGLTGIRNVHYFMEELQRQLLEPALTQLALYVVAVDNLQVINDAYGHEIGDQVLQRTAEILKKHFERNEGSVGIYHTALLACDPQSNSVRAVEGNARDLIEQLTMPYYIEHMEISVKVNVGIALAPEHSMEAKLLFKKANMASAEASKRGSNHFGIFQTNIYRDSLKRITLEKQLRRAVENKEFEVYYQPRIAIDTLQVTGCEALVRWNHPNGKVVYPGHFIGLAESLGFISLITEQVIRQVARQTKVWSSAGYPIKVSFNISGKEFDALFIKTLSDIIHEEGCDPTLLEIEITETATLKDMVQSRTLVETLQGMGFSVALDDFGTGYSSMTYIKMLSADKLKIDKSFIDDIKDIQQKAVVESMIDLGRKLNYTINVEGVETLEQLEILREMCVDEVQGWYFSKAIKAKEFIKYVDKRRRSPGVKINTESMDFNSLSIHD